MTSWERAVQVCKAWATSVWEVPPVSLVETAIDAAVAEAVAQERERIVRWLSEEVPYSCTGREAEWARHLGRQLARGGTNEPNSAAVMSQTPGGTPGEGQP